MSIQLGVIAEDIDDIKVINQLIGKIVNPSSFSIKKFLGNGCGKLKSKACVWAKDLEKRGCKHIILIHDLDRENEGKLRNLLTAKLIESSCECFLVTIPIEEIEAWLLADSLAIKNAFNLRKNFPEINHPESVKSPKEFLGAKLHSLEKKRYIHTLHNEKIARNIDITTLTKCPSFTLLNEYILEKFPAKFHIQ